MFDQIDTIRREVSPGLNHERRAQLGQFMTPSRIARFMASLFAEGAHESVSLLDAGAGVGSLTAAFLERVQTGWGGFRQIQATAYEIDPTLLRILETNLADYQNFTLSFGVKLSTEVKAKDFIEDTILRLQSGRNSSFDYAILNPPYKKINSQSSHRQLLRIAGIETVNMYTAFVALSVLQMKQGGQIVAIIPRSFCNGPYYRPFRDLLLAETSIQQIHLFKSRSKAFGEDAVLQENIVIHLVKGEPQAQVTISTSTDDTFNDLQTTAFNFDQIVKANSEKVFHIPTSHQENGLELPTAFRYSLAQIGLTVSTGPVVDFRVKEHLRMQPDELSVPLLYPAHFGEKSMNWPKPDFKKANAIDYNTETAKWLYPAGFYAAVKRFSSKEEKKRIVARVVSPEELPGSHYGFENHLNIFHSKKQGLTEPLALGLAVYLNSSLIDQYFRQFNGHTQVNATDLRLLKYPSQEALESLGNWAKKMPAFEQAAIDKKVASIS
ncbi:Eco57I restriction-modification methylase domain-containing protein [Spirosoma areae]